MIFHLFNSYLRIILCIDIMSLQILFVLYRFCFSISFRCHVLYHVVHLQTSSSKLMPCKKKTSAKALDSHVLMTKDLRLVSQLPIQIDIVGFYACLYLSMLLLLSISICTPCDMLCKTVVHRNVQQKNVPLIIWFCNLLKCIFGHAF